MASSDDRAKLEAVADELNRGSSVQPSAGVESLSAERRAELATMRGLLENSLDAAEIEADNWLLKFLNAHGTPERAAEAYVAMKKWRKDNRIDTVLERPMAGNDLIPMVFPHAYLGFCKAGRPIYLEKTGRIHVDALVNSVPVNTVADSHVYGLERLRRMMRESSERTGRPVDEIVSILDLDGLGLYHSKAFPIVQSLLQIDSKYYPELVGPIFVVNSPWIMPTLWEMVKPILPPWIKSKIHICGANFKEELLQAIDASQLPAEYGGTSGVEVKVHPYEELREYLLRDASGLRLHEEYVAAGAAFEKSLEGEAGTVFLWSFEADPGYDVGFSVRMVAQGGDESKPVLVKPESRCNSSKGEYVATGPCTLHFKWDNSFSYFNGKNLKYHVSAVAAQEHTGGN